MPDKKQFTEEELQFYAEGVRQELGMELLNELWDEFQADEYHITVIQEIILKVFLRHNITLDK